MRVPPESSGARRAKAAACRSQEVPWWFFWSRARQASAVGAEPLEVGGEPCVDGGEFVVGERFGAWKKADGLGDFGELHGFEDAFEAGSCGSGSELREGEGWGHAGCRGDEPCAEVGGGVLGVAFFFGEDEGSYESGDLDAEVEERVAVSGEGYGCGRVEQAR